MRALLIVNRHKENASNFASVVEEKLRGEGAETRTMSSWDEDSGWGSRFKIKDEWKPDIVFSIGGDGTALFAAREFSQNGTPILPIHMGTTGFMSSAHDSGWQPLYEAWLSGGAEISRRMMLQITLERKGKAVFEVCCLNDAVISADGIAKIIKLNVSMRGETIGKQRDELETRPRPALSNIEMGSFRSDGLIAATATGSTAYSAAAGGPILDPEMEAIIINPVCPFTLANRPIVAPSEGSVIVEVENGQRSGVLLTVDGQLTEKLIPLDRVVIKKAPEKAALVGGNRAAFYKSLSMKLGWSGGEE
jgi:NAD+ kinase